MSSRRYVIAGGPSSILLPSLIRPSLQVINPTSSPGSMDLLKTICILLTNYRLMKEWQAPLIMLVLWRIVIVGVRNCKRVDKGRDSGCGIIDRVQEDVGNIDHQFPHVGITILSQPPDELVLLASTFQQSSNNICDHLHHIPANRIYFTHLADWLTASLENTRFIACPGALCIHGCALHILISRWFEETSGMVGTRTTYIVSLEPSKVYTPRFKHGTVFLRNFRITHGNRRENECEYADHRNEPRDGEEMHRTCVYRVDGGRE
jgi:hypothetical protein